MPWEEITVTHSHGGTDFPHCGACGKELKIGERAYRKKNNTRRAQKSRYRCKDCYKRMWSA